MLVSNAEALALKPVNRSNRSRSAPRFVASIGGRCTMPMGVGMVAAFVLGSKVDDASAAALGGAVSQFGLLTAILAFLVVRAWQTHLLFASVTTLGGLLALVIGASLIWRYSGARQSHRLAAPALPSTRGDGAPMPAGAQQIPLPVGVDRQQLLAELRRTFLALQSAWDQGSPVLLGQMTTPEMLEELCSARSAGYGMPQRSEVLTLDVHLIAFEEVEAAHLACVEFSGLLSESSGTMSERFQELWMLTRSTDGSGGWRLAKHQALL